MLIEFNTERGGKVSINPDDVECVTEPDYSNRPTYVRMRSGKLVEVMEGYASVVEKLNGKKGA